MVKVRKRGEEVRQFILENVETHPKDIALVTSERFNISRQAVNKHLNFLASQQAIQMAGTTKDRRYFLCPQTRTEKTYSLQAKLQEDLVWREDVLPVLRDYPDNVIQIWNYCFTEMLNNAIDHSSGEVVTIQVARTAIDTEIIVYDNGEGIFRKIQRELGLHDERHAILELSKGKLTTDPSRHTGEGIFFSSRMVDDFIILSGKTFFSHEHADDLDWIVERQKFQTGTGVFMKMRNNTARSVKEVFDKFTSEENYGFTKTVIPVKLVQYGDEMLVSRSQAKRLISRIDRFETVILDFDGVNSIGQAFADEIFRVFSSKNRQVNLLHVNANKDVEKMIVHALLNG